MLPVAAGGVVGAAGVWRQQQPAMMGMRARGGEGAPPPRLRGGGLRPLRHPLNPAEFQTQIEVATGAGKGQCTATAAQAMDLRAGALLVLLTGAAQAVAAAAAEVAAGTAARAVLGRFLAFAAHVAGVANAFFLYDTVRGVAAVAIGRCLGNDYRVTLVLAHVLVAVPFSLLVVVGLVVVARGV